MHRWQILFNITTLRLISFNMDYHWSCTKGTTLEVLRLVSASDLTLEEGGRYLRAFRSR